MIKTYTFEEYLQDVHMSDYTGTDDDAPDAFDAWMENLTQDELIELADKYGVICALGEPH